MRGTLCPELHLQPENQDEFTFLKCSSNHFLLFLSELGHQRVFKFVTNTQQKKHYTDKALNALIRIVSIDHCAL